MALEAGARLEVVRRPTLALDLDFPADLAVLQEMQANLETQLPQAVSLPKQEHHARKEIG
jgi:hypothetical protein